MTAGQNALHEIGVLATRLSAGEPREHAAALRHTVEDSPQYASFGEEAVDELQERRIRADERGGGMLPGISASRLLHGHEIVLKQKVGVARRVLE